MRFRDVRSFLFSPLTLFSLSILRHGPSRLVSNFRARSVITAQMKSHSESKYGLPIDYIKI